MSKYARPELLAPAGSIHHVRAALSYGADAVYAGIPRWSLRVRGNGFTREDFKTGIELAHSMGKKFFAVLNVIPHARRLSTFEEDLDSVAALKPDAFIMADPGLIDLALTRHPEIPVHLSVQANTVNPLSVKFWQKLGVRRCILARELSLSEIGIIREACPDMELEVFIHGALCIAVSGRCLISGLLSRRDASLGVVQGFGALTVSAGLSADRYMLWRGTRTTFGLGGSLSYRFTDNLSATLFGRYVGGGSFVSPASLPYVGASGYGGYVTLTGGALGVDLGVESYYDAFARRWVTSPIVTPKVKVSEKFTIELPVGWMVKEMIDNAVNNNRRRGGPMIMPDNVPAPGRIPFGAPEMPR